MNNAAVYYKPISDGKTEIGQILNSIDDLTSAQLKKKRDKK